MTGLVNSVIHARHLPAPGPCVQVALFPDDTQRQIADLEARLAESEAAYAALCDYIEVLEAARRALNQEVACWRQRCEMAEQAWMRCLHGSAGRGR